MRIILVLTWPSKLQLAKKTRGQIEVEATNGFLYHYYQTDHLGTPLRMTTATGIISWQAQASTFGDTKIDMQIASTRLAAENNHRFPGQYYDTETGLHQNYFRDYEASIGRYVLRDPIGLDGGINTFGYVGGNPLNLFDYYGLAEMCTRMLYPFPLLPAQHCFVSFDDGTTSSFTSDGTGDDAAPDWWPGPSSCQDLGDKDDCIKKEMNKCKGEQYNVIGFNCCHCIEEALKTCNSSIPDKWPNWPANPSPNRPTRPKKKSLN